MITVRNTYQRAEQLMWSRALDFIQHENIFLKNTIAEILKNGVANNSLEEIEFFQNQFLNKDAVIALLRRDIAMQNQQVEKERNSDTNAARAATKRNDQLREDMAKMEKEFSQLKYSFTSYLSKNL